MPFLGVSIAPAADQGTAGALVVGVVPGSRADQAGIVTGGTITALRTLLLQHNASATVTLEWFDQTRARHRQPRCRRPLAHRSSSQPPTLYRSYKKERFSDAGGALVSHCASLVPGWACADAAARPMPHEPAGSSSPAGRGGDRVWRRRARSRLQRG
jgi:hypothetical protein